MRELTACAPGLVPRRETVPSSSRQRELRGRPTGALAVHAGPRDTAPASRPWGGAPARAAVLGAEPPPCGLAGGPTQAQHRALVTLRGGSACLLPPPFRESGVMAPAEQGCQAHWAPARPCISKKPRRGCSREGCCPAGPRPPHRQASAQPAAPPSAGTQTQAPARQARHPRSCPRIPPPRQDSSRAGTLV